MKNDADLERELEAWLSESASPMPDRLAESIADVPARHGQVSGRARPIWMRRVAFASALAATVVVLAIVSPIIVQRTQTFFGSASSPPTFTWDAVLNFREAPNQLNPSPDSYGNPAVWSYLRSQSTAHDPSEYIPFADFEPSGEKNWYDADYVNLFVGLAPGDDRLTLHPWGGSDDVRASIVAWRSPVDGAVTMRGDVQGDRSCGDGTILSIDQASTTLESIDVHRGVAAFEVRADVTEGDTLYFRVDPGNSSNCDSTWLRLQIEK
jgi:hypothetical protein